MSDNRKPAIPQSSEDYVPRFSIGKTNSSTMPDVATIKPHRHDHQTIIWTHSGTSLHLVDGHAIELIPGSFCMVAKGQVHQFVEVDADFAVTAVRFNDGFLPEAMFGQTWSYRAALFNNQGALQQALAAPTDEIPEIESLLQLMLTEHERAEAFRKDDGLRALLQFLLLRVARLQQESDFERSTVNGADYTLYRDFVTTLENQFAKQHFVQFYADAMNTSAGKLSEVTKQVLGKPVKEAILDRIYLEAKRLLQFSDLSIKEIAFALGYDTPHHFSRAFKNRVEASPNEYRENNQQNGMR